VSVPDDRKLEVLRAIVTDYVSTNEPVGSKALVERHHLRVSPATIRNEMAALEEEGYIAQPHTSAGRVPTDKGYRLFVDRLSSVKPLSVPERRAIESFLDGAADVDDVVRRTVRLLAQLTRQVAVVQYPSLSRSTVRHVELVSIAPSRVLVVMIVGTGQVEQRVIDLPEPVDDEAIRDLRDAVNGRIAGRQLADSASLLSDLPDAVAASHRALATLVVSVVLETMVEAPEERVVLAGTANLTRFGDLPHMIQPILEALEEHVVLLRLLGQGSDPEAITVSIGEENPYRELRGASVVSAGYGSPARALARLGVLGPTRMDYPGTMGAVRAVARYVGRILAEA
jgi:heat-inducible transcriptional repressor